MLHSIGVESFLFLSPFSRVKNNYSSKRKMGKSRFYKEIPVSFCKEIGPSFDMDVSKNRGGPPK